MYLADYALLDGAEAGDFPNGQKYLAAPLALFVVNKATGRLQPVAIQCHQRPGPDNPVFTPRDGWNWTIAKTFVEIADGNVHEALTHLGRTHLSMEPFVVSTYRQLAGNHPLHLLLQPHFEGTLAINEAAWRHLIASRGAVEKLFSASLPAAQGLAASGVREQQIMQSLLPLTFRDRGVDDTSALPHYPYRDDALLYWNAIRPWVESYSRLYYAGDRDVAEDVAEDVELQAWVRELSAPDGGRLSGLPQGGQKIETRSETPPAGTPRPANSPPPWAKSSRRATASHRVPSPRVSPCPCGVPPPPPLPPGRCRVPGSLPRSRRGCRRRSRGGRRLPRVPHAAVPSCGGSRSPSSTVSFPPRRRAPMPRSSWR
jgi:hypothetical protein